MAVLERGHCRVELQGAIANVGSNEMLRLFNKRASMGAATHLTSLAY